MIGHGFSATVDKVVLMQGDSDRASAPLSHSQLRTAEYVHLEPAAKAIIFDRWEMRDRWENILFERVIEPIEVSRGDVVSFPLQAVRSAIGAAVAGSEEALDMSECLPKVKTSTCLLDRFLEDA